MVTTQVHTDPRVHCERQRCGQKAREIDCCIVMPAPAVLAEGLRDAIWITIFVEYFVFFFFCLVVWYPVEVDWDVELCRCLEDMGKVD